MDDEGLNQKGKRHEKRLGSLKSRDNFHHGLVSTWPSARRTLNLPKWGRPLSVQMVSVLRPLAVKTPPRV
jgi:hypothetical protein